MSDFSVDNSDFVQLVADLGKIPAVAHENVRTAVEQTAKAVQTGWNEQLYNDGHAFQTRGAISYDLIEGFAGVGAEIGPRRGYRQAGIVLLLENGSVHNPPHGGGAGALEAQEDDFGARLAFAIDAATRGLL